MGQRNIDAECESYFPFEYSYSCIEPFPLSKDEDIVKPQVIEEPAVPKNSIFTAENLNRWLVRFTRAKKISRRAEDLRRQAVLHSSIVRTKEDLRSLQTERQKRWRELRSVLGTVETSRPSYFTEEFMKSKMAADQNKMADDANKMAADQASPALKRGRCDCADGCGCALGAEPSNKKVRREEEVNATEVPEADHHKRKSCSTEERRPKVQRVSCRMEDDEDLQSLAVFLDTVHFETRNSG